MSGETNTNPSAAPMVLLVEDHQSSADGYAELLAGAGYRVARAKDGYEALAKVSQEPPSVVLLDLKLPKLDGWDLLRRLKADAAMASVPIIVVTGDSLPTHHEMARSRGAVAVLSKPIVPGELLTVVRDALKGMVPSLH
jgi:chemosensory pili system protein ChpA (sensor histidine kinase/response regulator)